MFYDFENLFLTFLYFQGIIFQSIPSLDQKSMRVVLAPVRATQKTFCDQAPCHLARAPDNGLRPPAPEIKRISL
jgi:hypothetical protein